MPHLGRFIIFVSGWISGMIGFGLVNYFLKDQRRLAQPQLNRHGHKTVETNDKSKYKCSECLQMAFGERLECKLCSYEVHPRCQFAPNTVKPPFLGDCNFVLFSSGGGKCYCEACGKETVGCYYKCEHCDKVIHLYCAELKPTIDVGENIHLKLKERMTSSCSKCCLGRKKRKMTTWGYVTENEDCQFHIYCVKKLVADIMSKDTSRQIIQKFFRNGARRLLKIDLWIKVVASIASVLMGSPAGFIGVVEHIINNDK